MVKNRIESHTIQMLYLLEV